MTVLIFLGQSFLFYNFTILMQFFYSSNINSNFLSLDNEDSKHCVKVLRKKNGDNINILDGNGNVYLARIIDNNLKETKLEVISKIYYEREKFGLHIGISLLKSVDRFEWFVEKACELGVTEISPIICKNTEKNNYKIERLKKITISSIKQSQNKYLPIINDITTFNNLISNKFDNLDKYIAFCNSDDNIHFNKFNLTNKSIIVLIGPEGDFSTNEIKLALENDFKGISLGKNRLRTETAGIFACSIYNLQNSK